MSLKLDKEKTKKNIAVILDRIRNEADPQLLNEYRSLFKKEVSLFSRSYAAAYLLMLYDQESAGRSPRSGGRNRGVRNREREGNTENRNNSGEGEGKCYPLAEEDSKYLFISIGRNRRVFPREILGLINAKAAIPREDVGVIRILDKYSFVQIRNSSADTVIEALNGKSFRGRTLQVNYAHTRREASDENGEDAGITTDGDYAGDVYAGQNEGVSESGQKLGDDHPDEKDI
jgi:RNA recognition motif-containing protein